MGQQSTDSRQKASLLAELLQNMQLTWRLMADPRVSALSKTLLPLLGLLYLLAPVDLMPDVFPLLGQIDDVAVVLLLMRLFINLAPADAVAQHRADLSWQSAARRQQQSAGTSRNGPESRRGDVVDAEYRVVKDD